MAVLTQANKYSIAGYRRGERTRDQLLVLVSDVANNRRSDQELADRLDLSVRAVKWHLKFLRGRGIISTAIFRSRTFVGTWKNFRLISITEAGHDAVRQSKIRLEGSHHPG